MTPERQSQITAFLSDLSEQFTARIAKDSLDDLDSRLVDLQASIMEDGDLTLLGLLNGINEQHGKDDGESAQRFYACCAAMTLATYLSRVKIE